MMAWAKRLIGVGTALAILTLGGFGAWAQTGGDTQVITGTIDNSTTSKTYPIQLEAGQALLVTTEATSGNLDTVLNLYEPNSQRIAANNDDRADDTLDSAIGYIATKGGSYSLEITRYDGTSSTGNFRLSITVGDPSILSALDAITRIHLSGPMQVRDTEHFRIHYTTEGVDRVTPDYLNQVVEAVEDVYNREINELGWPAPPSDGVMGGNSSFDLYLGDLIGSGEGALGYTSPESIVGDNPNTPEVEEAATTSYMQVDNDFHDVSEGQPISLMRTTFAHEFHHAIQFGFDGNDSHNWLYEATASWMETVAMPEDEDATGYVSYAYEYPELCFGTTNDPGQGQLQYGEWTFLQHVTDEFGDDAAITLWRNVALFDGFQSVQATINDYNGGTLEDFFAAYRVKDLARDYVFAPSFNATVWMEDQITHNGRWTFSGQGIQELGANYFQFNIDPNESYYAGLVNDGGSLQLYGLGISNGQLSEISLGRGGTIRPGDYDYFYLMVFNPVWDEDVNDCTYYDYQIDVSSSKGEPSPVTRTWDASHFEPLS